MELIIWATIVGGMGFMIWYGYNLLVKRPGVGGDDDGAGPVASCHLCRRSFPVSRMVSRDKIAGFVNYFCGDCIEGLYNEYVGRFRDGAGAHEENLGGRISRN